MDNLHSINCDPQAVEPIDKVWPVGVSGLTENPSPFPRVNKMLKWTKERDSSADSQRALIVTEGYKKYAMYPENVKWGLILRDLYSQVKINIWPGELIVGELAAEPCSAPIYPEFSMDWLCREFRDNVMEVRTNDRYVVPQNVKDDILSIVELELQGLYQRVDKMGFSLTVSDEARKFIALKGYDRQFGARPLRRSIQKYLEDTISEFVIEHEPSPGTRINAVLSDDSIKLETT